jgi:hypothetical protein
MYRRSRLSAGLGSIAVLGATAVVGTTGSAAATRSHTRNLSAHLDSLNDSGAHDHADVMFHRSRPAQAHVDIDA